MKFARAHATPMHIKLLIHGLSGAGKSHIGATAGEPGKDGSDVAILLFEANGLPTIAQVNPKALLAKAYAPEECDCRTAYEVMLGFVRAASDGTFAAAGITTIVVDSATEAMRAIREEVVRLRVDPEGKKTPEEVARLVNSYVVSLPDRGEINQRTLRMIRTFRDLPFDVVMLALTDVSTDGEEKMYEPSFEGREVPRSIMGFFSAVGYALKHDVKELVDGTEKTRTKHYVRFEGPTKWSVKPCRPLQNIEPMEDARSGDWLKRIRAYQHPVAAPAAPAAPAATPTENVTPTPDAGVTPSSPAEPATPPAEAQAPAETAPSGGTRRRR